MPEHPEKPDPRVGLSMERTLLSWVRTGVSLIALGIVLAKFVLFLGHMGLDVRGVANTERLGFGLVIAGGALVALAGWRHLRQLRRWRAGQDPVASPLLVVLLVLVVVGGAAFAAFSILP